MATIHEVAKLAGVSTATVSKYINKNGYIRPEKCQAIQAAIDQLNYAPNRSAKQLKTSQSADLLFVAPNMNEKIYREIFSGIDAVLGSEFRIIIRLSNDNPERETSILRDCLQNPCAGLFLCTCCPGNTELFDQLNTYFPIIFMLRRPEKVHSYNFIGFNHREAVSTLTSELIRLGYSDIGLFTGDSAFSDEADAVEGFRNAYDYSNLPVPENQIFSFPYSREETFRRIMAMFDRMDYPRVFITTSYFTAHSIHEIAYFRNLELGRDLLLFSLGEDSWYNSMFVNKIICTFRDAQKLGSTAARMMKDNQASQYACEPMSVLLSDDFAFDSIGKHVSRLKNTAPPRISAQPKVCLRIAANQEDAGTHALKSLVHQFAKQEGIDVQYIPVRHEKLYAKLLEMSDRQSDEFDLFTVDAPWLPYMYQKQLLYDLTEHMLTSSIPRRLEPDVLQKLCTYNGRILGLPLHYTLSILFYRKDFFADPELSRRFYEKYRVQLEPPKTWHMFNLVADFFTRSSNPDSPTAYGTSIFGGKFPSATCSELFPRIWSYGGSVFDRRGFVRLYSYANYRALQSMMQTIHCCPPDTLDFNAFNSLEELLAGNTAMCMFFSHNASLLADSVRNPIRSTLGFAPIPGRKPVTSGWGLSINRYSRHIEEAKRFIDWFSGMEVSSAYTILGGISPYTALLEHEPLMQLYPWNSVARSEYSTSLPRDVPSLPGIPLLDEMYMEELLSSIIFDHFEGKGNLDDLLYNAHMELCAFAEAHGYPHNLPPQRLNLE